MEETKLESRLSGNSTSKALGVLERRGIDVGGKLSMPINRVPRRPPAPPKRKSNHPAQ
jgi:hypothetical protein